MDIGKKITFLRTQKGWSQYKLYKMAGISQSNLSRIEAGTIEPGVEMLQKICSALGVSMAEFDDNAGLTQALEIADKMNLTGEYIVARDKLKAMPEDEQQARLDKAYEQMKRLSPEAKEALLVLIRNLSKEVDR